MFSFYQFCTLIYDICPVYLTNPKQNLVPLFYYCSSSHLPLCLSQYSHTAVLTYYMYHTTHINMVWQSNGVISKKRGGGLVILKGDQILKHALAFSVDEYFILTPLSNGRDNFVLFFICLFYSIMLFILVQYLYECLRFFLTRKD